MPIVKSTSQLAAYPFQRISPEIVSQFRHLGSPELWGANEIPLKLLECYCDITNQRIDHPIIDQKRFNTLIAGFVGAMNDPEFSPNERTSRRQITSSLLEGFKQITINQLKRKSLTWTQQHFEYADCLWETKKNELNKQSLTYWAGWEIVSRKGDSFYLRLANLWNSHGASFTTEFYEHWRLFFEKMERPGYTEVSLMADYLAANSVSWPADTFQHPTKIRKFFEGFMVFFFQEVLKRELDINSQIKAFGRFISNVQEVFIDSGKWVTPFGGLPKPVARGAHYQKTRLRKTDDGVVVHEKLITSVPLHVTDEQAIEIIFSDISRDMRIVCKWAASRVLEIRKRQKIRDWNITQLKTAEDIQPANCTELDRKIYSSFSKDGFNPLEAHIRSNIDLHVSRPHLNDVLAIPLPKHLFPFMCLLTAIHPEITSGFLYEFELYDKHGHLTGFKKDDSAYIFTGFKLRAGTPEKKIHLKPRAAAIVRMIIELTEPLRNYLKSKGDDNWRRLFLSAGKAYAEPMPPSPVYWSVKYLKSNGKLADELESQFAQLTSLNGDQLLKFLSRISLSTIRASAGVIVFLKTKSVDAMAKALGHSKYDPNLLSHYLPDALVEFFQSRWIRIFQKAIIAHAMRDSPLLLEALQFESLAEVTEFLKQNALKDIPDCDPKDLDLTIDEIDIKSQVFIQIDAGILTTLLSIQQAIHHADKSREICGTARYWADVTALVTKNIVNGNDRLLKNHLDVAMKHCDGKKMEKLVYATC